MSSTDVAAARSGLSAARFVRPRLRELDAYHLEQSECRYKLDQNEVPWDMPRRLKARVTERLLECNWAGYPDFHSDRLRAALAAHHGRQTAEVLVGNGSNELLGIALEAVGRSGGEVLGCLPSFGLYEMFVRRASAVSRFLAPRPDLGLQIDELSAEIDRDPTRPVILCSPNNPTGAAATVEQVQGLLERLRAPLLLDNAYGEFCRYDYRPLLDRFDNLLLFRTFSKAWSLGGMRLGDLFASADLIAELIKVKLPYNLNHAASLSGLVALEEAAVAERRVRVLIARRQQWRDMLLDFGFEVPPSEGNFLLAGTAKIAASQRRIGRGAANDGSQVVTRIRDGLAQRGILVRDVSGYPGLAGCLRVAVGSGPALRAVRQALEEIL
ncbi:MAG: histidinol-phosphate transaminase [Acidobacteria bacterium]|nr:histidinol-phosphate transaminase [Acidobacteriota bacterium]